jgi:Ca2+-binding EF-hand superfamily protein
MPVEIGVDSTALFFSIGVGLVAVAVPLLCLIDKGLRTNRPRVAVDVSRSLDKQRAEAQKANREFHVELDDIFKIMDKSGSGMVSKRELKAALKASDVVMHALGVKRLKDGLEFFDKADANHDGAMSLEEFKNYVHKLEASIDKAEENRARGVVSPADMKMIESAFAAFDTGGDHKISTDELTQVYSHMAKAKGKGEVQASQAKNWVAKLMRRYDRDHDGTISFEEFVPMCLRGPFHEIFEK